MSSVSVYQIACPSGHSTELPETILEGIIQHLRGSYTGEPVLNFVCSDCKTAFHFDYPNRTRVGQTDAPRHLSEFHVLSVQSGCDGRDCVDHILLVAVRNRDISGETVQQESKTWNVSGVKCKSGHRALPIGEPKLARFFGD